MQNIRKTFIIVTIFAIAMGFLETAVVLYLRAMYYPHGFELQTVVVSKLILKTELLRELATIIMLICIGWIAGKTKAQRFVYFLYSFAIWDLFYYIFLKLLLDWPSSVFGWDILFLLPTPWYGPVLAPCIISVSMIALTLIVLYFESKNVLIQFSRIDWALMIIASLIFIASFTTDFIFWFVTGHHTLQAAQFEFLPKSYNWWVFAVGEIILLIDFGLIYKKHLKEIRN